MAREGAHWPERAPRIVVAAMVASAVLCGLAAALVVTDRRILAGLVALMSGAALIAGSLQARRAGLPHGLIGRAKFAERVLEVVFDASILVPLAWVMRSGSKWNAILAMVGLGSSYLASYQRARGESLGYAGSESLGYRLTREAILVLGLLSGWIAGALWTFAVLTAAAAAVRAWNIVIQERNARSVEKATG